MGMNKFSNEKERPVVYIYVPKIQDIPICT